MGAIQIRNAPSDVHQRLRERARREGMSLSEYVLAVLERDLAVPTTREWLERVRQDEPVSNIASQDIVSLIREGRVERDEQILRALSDRD
jgi:plasmid stability protein